MYIVKNFRKTASYKDLSRSSNSYFSDLFSSIQMRNKNLYLWTDFQPFDKKN